MRRASSPRDTGARFPDCSPPCRHRCACVLAYMPPIRPTIGFFRTPTARTNHDEFYYQAPKGLQFFLHPCRVLSGFLILLSYAFEVGGKQGMEMPAIAGA